MIRVFRVHCARTGPGLPGLCEVVQGDLLWERFGHNALGIRDTRTGTDLVFNWGMFSFEQPGFLPRFLRGEMRYWMAAFDATQMLLAYQQDNRSVTVQRLNLTAAQHVVHFDRWWNPAVEDQATDRAHRIGQDKAVMVYRFVVEDTVEQKMVELGARKREVAESALGRDATAGKKLTMDDVNALLEAPATAAWEQ